MKAEETIAFLTKHATLDSFVLIADEDGRFSVFTTAPDGGLAVLLIEREEQHEAAVAFLMKRGAPQYKSMAQYSATSGWDGIARAKPIGP